MVELRNVCKAFGDVRVLPFRVNRMNYNGLKKGNVTFVVIGHKRKLLKNIVNKEIELKLGIE